MRTDARARGGRGRVVHQPQALVAPRVQRREVVLRQAERERERAQDAALDLEAFLRRAGGGVRRAVSARPGLGTERERGTGGRGGARTQ